MDAAAEEPKRRRVEQGRTHIPPEILEIILMRLPKKSLYRFSMVSKSLRSLIFDPNFMTKRGDVRRLLMSSHCGVPLDGPCDVDPKFLLTDASSCPLSSVSSHNAADATPIVFPIEGEPILRASCGGLLCVEVNNSLYLWNPSINTYKNIPNPSLASGELDQRHIEYVYGLGYDPIIDDYKIFRLQLSSIGGDIHKSELYSLKSDSWRMIDHQAFSGRRFRHKKCVFVGGALHWSTMKTIISFDLATEKFGNIEGLSGDMELSAFRGKLCLHSSRSDRFRFHFVMWIMEEYGIEKSWSKIFDIENDKEIGDGGESARIEVTPLYIFDNGEVLFRVRVYETEYALFMNKGEEKRLGIGKIVCSGICHGCVYDEILISPLKFLKLD